MLSHCVINLCGIILSVCCGFQVKWADFILFSMIDVLSLPGNSDVSGAFVNSSKLQAYAQRFRNIPAIKRHIASRPDVIV